MLEYLKLRYYQKTAKSMVFGIVPPAPAQVDGLALLRALPSL